MIRAGSHGMLLVADTPVIRCTRWSLNVERILAGITPVYRWDEQSIPLGRRTSGDADLIYDLDDLGAIAAISNFRGNAPPPIALQLRTDRNSNSGYDLSAHISSVGVVVAVRDAHRVRVAFTATGPITPV